MKKFVSHVFLFTIASFCLLLFMDGLVSFWLKRSSNRIFASWRDLMQGRISSDIIILGNSRAWVQYSPAILDSILHCDSYNLGIDGSCLNRQITKYDIFRQYNQTPRMVLLNIDFLSFDFTHGYESFQYYPFFYNSIVREKVFPQEHFSWAERWCPFYRYTHLGLRNIPYDDRSLYKGYHAVDLPWDSSGLKELTSFGIAFNERTMEMLDSFLKRAQKEKIQVILVFAPVFYKAKDYLRNNDEFELRLERIREGYSLPILRYDDDPICRDTAFFYNATHLNKKGAELFSKQLAFDLLQLEQNSKAL